MRGTASQCNLLVLSSPKSKPLTLPSRSKTSPHQTLPLLRNLLPPLDNPRLPKNNLFPTSPLNTPIPQLRPPPAQGPNNPHRPPHNQTPTHRPVKITIQTRPPIIPLAPNMSVRNPETSLGIHNLPPFRRSPLTPPHFPVLILPRRPPLVQENRITPERYHALDSRPFGP